MPVPWALNPSRKKHDDREGFGSADSALPLAFEGAMKVPPSVNLVWTEIGKIFELGFHWEEFWRYFQAKIYAAHWQKRNVFRSGEIRAKGFATNRDCFDAI